MNIRKRPTSSRETAETAKRHLCLRLGDDPNEKTIFEAVKVLNEEAGSPEE